MHVYFVRHGKTELNEKHIHQSPNTPLSEKGREAVVVLAESLRGVNATLLISSEYTRALESARIIGQYSGLSPVVNGLFYEVVRPSALYHTSTFSLRTLWYMGMTALKRNDPQWRYADAENFFDIRNRAIRARAFLEELSKDHESVIVVSHTAFLHVLLMYLCYDRILQFSDLWKVFFASEHMKNASMIHAVYAPRAPRDTCAWQILENGTKK